MTVYRCDTCSYQTSRLYNLNRHKKRHLKNTELRSEQLNEQVSGSSKVLKNEQKVLKNEQKVLNRVAPSSSEILSEQPSNEQMSKKRAGTIIFDSDELLKLTNNEEYTAEQERLIREKELPNQIIDVSERLAKTTKPFIKKNTERIEPKNSKIGLGLLALILSLLFLLLFWNDIKNFISGFKKGSLVGSDFTIVRE